MHPHLRFFFPRKSPRIVEKPNLILRMYSTFFMLAMIVFHNTWDVDGFSWVSFGEGAHFAVAEDTLLMREIQDLD